MTFWQWIRNMKGMEHGRPGLRVVASAGVLGTILNSSTFSERSYPSWRIGLGV